MVTGSGSYHCERSPILICSRRQSPHSPTSSGIRQHGVKDNLDAAISSRQRNGLCESAEAQAWQLGPSRLAGVDCESIARERYDSVLAKIAADRVSVAIAVVPLHGDRIVERARLLLPVDGPLSSTIGNPRRVVLEHSLS